MSPASPSRRVLVAIVACFGLFLSCVIASPPAGATVPWSSMTNAQKQTAMAIAMFALLNQERAANHLTSLTGSTTLVISAYNHNLQMAKYNLMTHQCSGEASPGTRITNAGYHWRNWGENIGWTTDISIAGIQYMEKLMYGERAPDNGHRLNILGNFRNVGIRVYIDTVHHKMWYTQDFGTPY